MIIRRVIAVEKSIKNPDFFILVGRSITLVVSHTGPSTIGLGFPPKFNNYVISTTNVFFSR